jgi:hypothetical protein
MTMITDSALKYEAMNTLLKRFGAMDAERFITLIKRDTFDYTEWRRSQWNDMSIDGIFEEASEFAEKQG